MSEYFKNALELPTKFVLETPSKATQLPPLDDQHVEDLNHKLSDDNLLKSDKDALYHKEWKYKVALFL